MTPEQATRFWEIATGWDLARPGTQSQVASESLTAYVESLERAAAEKERAEIREALLLRTSRCDGWEWWHEMIVEILDGRK